MESNLHFRSWKTASDTALWRPTELSWDLRRKWKYILKKSQDVISSHLDVNSVINIIQNMSTGPETSDALLPTRVKPANPSRICGRRSTLKFLAISTLTHQKMHVAVFLKVSCTTILLRSTSFPFNQSINATSLVDCGSGLAKREQYAVLS